MNDTLSVVIPSINESATIVKAIESAFATGATQVIVVDGGSQDDTCSLSQAAGATVIHSPPGRGKQLQVGVAAASGDWIVMLHADSRLNPGLAQALASLSEAQASKHPQMLWGCLQQRIDDPRRAYRLIEWGNYLRARWLRTPYGDQAIWAHRLAFEPIGGIPDIPIMEDVALARRLSRLGPCRVVAVKTFTSARRWNRDGLWRRTLGNWILLFRYLVLKQSPQRLLRDYQ